MKKKNNFSAKKLVTLGLLIAMDIILTRFLSISAWNVRIGFSFIALVAAAVLYGPVEAAVVGGVADFFGAILFPTGAYFPGFTVTAILTGLVYGFFFRKKVTILRAAGATAIIQFVLGMLLNTCWISMLYGSAFMALLPVRAAQALLLFIVQTAVIFGLQEVLFKRIHFFADQGAL